MKKSEQDAILDNNPNFENKAKSKADTKELAATTPLDALKASHVRLVKSLLDVAKQGKASGQIPVASLVKALEGVLDDAE